MAFFSVRRLCAGDPRPCQLNSGREKQRRSARFAPGVEPLEDRVALSFFPAVDYAVGTGPQVPVVGSFRQDGTRDLAVANYFDHTVTVRLGNGDGSFGTARSFSSGGRNPVGLASANFRTGSGVPDLAVVNSSSNTVSVLLGNGDGSFQSPSSYGGLSSPQDVRTGVLRTGSGMVDLIVNNRGSSDVTVFLGNGDGTFQDPMNVGTGAVPRVVRVADLDGDGNLDLVVTHEQSDTVGVLLGNGDGTFRSPTEFPANHLPTDVEVGEFRSGSGLADLVVSNAGTNTVSVLLGNGDGTFQAPVSYSIGVTAPFPAVAIGDFNGDGNADIVTTNFGDGTISVLLGNGDGTFQAPMTYSVGGLAAGVTVDDLNGDGFPDIVTANYSSNSVSVVINDGMWGPGPIPGGKGGPLSPTAGNDSREQSISRAVSALEPFWASADPQEDLGPAHSYKKLAAYGPVCARHAEPESACCKALAEDHSDAGESYNNTSLGACLQWADFCAAVLSTVP